MYGRPVMEGFGMDHNTVVCTPLTGKASMASPVGFGCPVCSGPMLPQRGLWVCQRCGLPLCLGCESEVDSEVNRFQGD